MARDFLLELGAEEIPSSFISPALEELQRAFTERLAAARLGHGEVKTFGTPRRLAVLVRDVEERSADSVREVSGPSVKAAFAPDGKPTRAAEKFAESVRLPVEKLLRLQTPKGEYVGARVEERGRSAEEIFKELLHPVIHGLNFKKSMRWGDVEQTFARPLHWIVALLGEEVLPVIFGDVRSGRVTRGHRFLTSGALELKNPAEYEGKLEQAHVIADLGKRRALLQDRVNQAASEAGGRLLVDDALMDQVVNLVELPNPVVGTFEPKHLELPPEVLVQEMKSHQRYFSLTDGDGKLLPKFIAVSNTPVKDPALSLRGYQRVLRSRLADGRFFFDEDLKTPLAEQAQKLGRVVWQGKLGTYAEKVERFGALAMFLAKQTGREGQRSVIERAAVLAKADLVTGMVGEFPELQGVMGREYARAGGEPAAVSLAISEHYLPRGSADGLPTQDPGALVGIADRLDSLAGLFALGKPPTGAADPFALRRACLAVIHIVLGRGYRFSLSAALAEALRLLEPKLADVKRKPQEASPHAQLLEFFRGRLKALWGERYRADVVEAVLAAGFDDLCAAQARVQALDSLVRRPDFAPLAVAFRRVANIVEKQGQGIAAGPADPAKLVDEAEKGLHRAYLQAQQAVGERIAKDDYAAALKAITELKPAVDLFFEKVMVMAEEPGLRENRIRLLVEIGGMFGRVADFTRVQVEAAS